MPGLWKSVENQKQDFPQASHNPLEIPEGFPHYHRARRLRSWKCAKVGPLDPNGRGERGLLHIPTTYGYIIIEYNIPPRQLKNLYDPLVTNDHDHRLYRLMSLIACPLSCAPHPSISHILSHSQILFTHHATLRVAYDHSKSLIYRGFTRIFSINPLYSPMNAPLPIFTGILPPLPTVHPAASLIRGKESLTFRLLSSKIYF
jgi:hypothetical protein